MPAHRGHGLGRWLKAVNIQALHGANERTGVVRTSNADSNAAMLAINHEMGFRPLIADMIWQATIAAATSAGSSPLMAGGVNGVEPP